MFGDEVFAWEYEIPVLELDLRPMGLIFLPEICCMRNEVIPW